MVILYTDIEKTSQEEFNRLMEFVPDEGRERILSYGFDMGRYRALAGELLGRYALCELKGIDAVQHAKQIKIGRTKNGKPFFIDENFYFNVSHSGRFVVCAVDSELVGIDIEKIRKLNLKVAERIFNTEELESLKNVADADRKFSEIWTQKESFIKADGRGFGYPDIKNIPLYKFSIKNIFIHDDYAAAVCYKTPGDFDIIEVDISKIFEPVQ